MCRSSWVGPGTSKLSQVSAERRYRSLVPATLYSPGTLIFQFPLITNWERPFWSALKKIYKWFFFKNIALPQHSIIVMFLYSKHTNCIKDNVLLLQEYSEKPFSNMSYYCTNKDKINAFFVVFYNSVSHCAPCHFCSENHMLERAHTRLCSNLDSFCCYQSLWCVWLRLGS